MVWGGIPRLQEVEVLGQKHDMPKVPDPYMVGRWEIAFTSI